MYHNVTDFAKRFLAMRGSVSSDGLDEALHLHSQANILSSRALELDKIIICIQDWISVFDADISFAEQRIVEIREFVVACESLTTRARESMDRMSSIDSDPFYQPPGPSESVSVSECQGTSDEAINPSLSAELNEHALRLRATSLELANIRVELSAEAQSSKVNVEKAENLLSRERQNLLQWEFLRTDLIRKKSAFLAFSMVAAGAAADYRCWKTSLEDRVGGLLASGSESD